ncbi:MAG: transglycosylase SLT domain-containing protein [Candidatus Eisenbacteria bacterium]
MANRPDPIRTAGRGGAVRGPALLLPLLLLLLSPPSVTGSPDIPEDPVDWLLLPADSLFRSGAALFDRSVAVSETMGWSEKEYRLREARLALGDLTAGERETERRRLAVLALRTGRDDRAVDLLDPWNSGDPEVMAAAGLAALRAGRNVESARLLRGAQALGAPADELIRYRLATALRWIPEEDNGLPLFLEIAADRSSPFRTSALHQAALLLYGRKRTGEAMGLLRKEHGAEYEDLVHRELIFLTAESEADSGNGRRAGILYKRLLERWPDHRRALESFRALRVLESEGVIPEDARLPLLGARAAREAGRTEEAIQLLLPLLDRPEEDPLHTEALQETGKTHYAAERYTAALETFDRLASREGEAGRVGILYRARSYKKMGQWRESIGAYREYVRRYPSSGLAAEVQWEIAWRLKLLGEWEESAEAFRLVRTRFGGSDFAGRAPLQEAHCLKAAGKPSEARRTLESLVRDGRGGRDRDDALFWIGDLAERTGDLAGAEEAFRKLVDESPESYCGLRAAGRLGRRSIVSPRQVRVSNETGDGALDWIREWNSAPPREGDPDWSDLSLYVFFGEWAEARREARDLRKKLDEDPEGLLALARRCREATLFDITIRCGRRIQELAERAGADPVHPYLLALIYPLAWLDVIVAETGKYEEMDPLFVTALMRQESWFQPDAASPAGARGLMQIIPATGRHIARSLGEGDGFDADDLYDPRINIRYGVRYLHDLLRRYQGDRLAAASAYNGGETNTDHWLAGAGPEEQGEFVERIGYSETREYVKRVLSGYWICRALYQHLASDDLLG